MKLKMKSWFHRKFIRPFRHWVQRRTRGFDDSVTWNLDGEFLDWIVPRAKRLHAIQNDAFERKEEDIEEFDRMIAIFEKYSEEGCFNKESKEELDEGLDLFKKHFLRMWW